MFNNKTSPSDHKTQLIFVVYIRIFFRLRIFDILGVDFFNSFLSWQEE